MLNAFFQMAVNQGHYFRQEPPLTFMLQNFDVDILQAHGLHWQQP